MKSFADRLRAARTQAGLTQEQLGAILGVTKSSVSAWENSRETPSFRLLPLLARSVGLSLDDLLTAPQRAQDTKSAPTVQAQALLQDEGERLGDYIARDSQERLLLQTYRDLPARKRKALLVLLAADAVVEVD